MTPCDSNLEFCHDWVVFLLPLQIGTKGQFPGWLGIGFELMGVPKNLCQDILNAVQRFATVKTKYLIRLIYLRLHAKERFHKAPPSDIKVHGRIYKKFLLQRITGLDMHHVTNKLAMDAEIVTLSVFTAGYPFASIHPKMWVVPPSGHDPRASFLVLGNMTLRHNLGAPVWWLDVY
jgi:hypothetical protein